MIRRFIVLLFVAGTAGLCVGLLYAPGPGTETRAKLSAVLEEHEGSLGELLTRGRDAFSDVAAAVSGGRESPDDES